MSTINILITIRNTSTGIFLYSLLVPEKPSCAKESIPFVITMITHINTHITDLYSELIIAIILYTSINLLNIFCITNTSIIVRFTFKG
jgi:hypothetical protein